MTPAAVPTAPGATSEAGTQEGAATETVNGASGLCGVTETNGRGMLHAHLPMGTASSGGQPSTSTNPEVISLDSDDEAD